jgi:hypothetical protein
MATSDLGVRAWARREFAGADLRDKRRTRRLVKVAAAIAAKPVGTLPPAFDGWADLKAAYRLLERQDVTFEKISAPHWHNTRQACGRPGQYLMIEDTTSLDFSRRGPLEGLGPIGDGRGRGLYLHSTLALRIEGWTASHEPTVTVVGLLGQHCWVRPPEPKHGRETRCQRLQRRRESERWAQVFEALDPARPDVQWIYVADRESDIYEVLQRCTRRSVDYVVRANQPRALVGESGSVFEAVSRAKPLGRYELRLRARPGVAARTAVVELRATRVTLRPTWRPGGPGEPQAVNVVEAKEIDAPAGVEPIRWVLLTNLAVGTFADARRVVALYATRWLIEDYHKALKTGVGAERTELATGDRIERLLGVLAIVAVRLLQMKFAATARPDEPVDPAVFGPEALAVLGARDGVPEGGWTNRAVTVAVARLGGYLARRSDGPPGWLTIWRGWQQLALMLHGYLLAQGETEKCG